MEVFLDKFFLPERFLLFLFHKFFIYSYLNKVIPFYTLNSKQMKRLTSQLLIAGLLTVGLIACKKDDRATQFDEVPQDILAQIKAHAFNNKNVQKIDGG